MNRREELIAELADDIASGERHGNFDAAFFLDSLIDQSRVSAVDVAVLLTCSELSDKHIFTADLVRGMVKADCIHYFTNSDRGIDYVDALLTEELEAA
jgi:hypothetical protein